MKIRHCCVVARFGQSLRRVLFAVFTLAFVLTDGAPRANAASNFASIVVDHHTGKVLHENAADDAWFPASLTKMMTLYVLFEELRAGNLQLETDFLVSGYAQKKPPTKVGVKAGQTIRVMDAIGALVTKSANDVAAVIAENIAMSEAQFAGVMTVRARLLGMSQTTFRNASGLPDSTQVTTARDMAILSRRLIEEFPEYYHFFSLKAFEFNDRRYSNHNGLLYSYRGTDGIKTGYTRASGFNLAASVKREGKHLVAVVLGGKTSKQRNRHMIALLNRTLPRASVKSPPLPQRKPEPAPAHVASDGEPDVS